VDRVTPVRAATPVRVPRRERVVLAQDGSGVTRTRPFTVERGWTIQWKALGRGVFQIYVKDAEGLIVDVAANETGPSSGTSYQPRAGTYFLETNASQSWSLQVVQLGQE
jgi:hypothetical protein